MKKYLPFFIFILFSTTVSAQEVKNVVKINPLSAFYRIASVFYERALSEKTSVQLGIAFSAAKFEDTKYSGLALTPEYRFYLKKQAPRGVYLAPFVKYQRYTTSDNVDKGTYKSFGGGFMLGHQWVYKSSFVLDLFIGPAYNAGTYTAEYGNGNPDFNAAIDGLGVRGGLAIGFGF
ncbi:MAG: DUF3575 domain-containing protein [Sphingobacteriaceae bacterium]